MNINNDAFLDEPKAHHLLVVDDDRINRELLTHLFERDYEISTAGGGVEALKLLKDKPDIDLVMLDIMMPQMSGMEVLTEIRENPDTHELPVILISAMANTRDVVNGLRLGANDYITKPVDVSVVVARVKTQLTVKRLLDERKETIAELERAEKLRAQLFRIASHDLKTPLNNISMAEHLLRKTITPSKDTGQILDTKPIDLTDVVYNVLTQYEISADKKNIKLEMGEVDGWVTADAARLVQVVSNLVSNAITYSPHDTKIDVYATMKEDKGYLYVKDEGPGIPEAEREQLFTEFGKLSTAPTGGESSTGLGLWIVKHLTSLQNGTVGVEFPESGGSLFWIALPECPPPSATKNNDEIETKILHQVDVQAEDKTTETSDTTQATSSDEEAPKSDAKKDEDDTVSARPKLPVKPDDESAIG